MAPPRRPPPLMDVLVEEILLRFPLGDPASLVRAALVCKPWRRIVSDEGFRRRFREFHRRGPVLLEKGVVVISERTASAGVVGREGYELIGCWDGSLMAEDEAPVGGTSAKAAEAAILSSGKQPAASDDTHRIAHSIKLVARLADTPDVSTFGILICDVTGDYSELRFIPLPDKCELDGQMKYPHPRESSSMAAVGGFIKFVSMDGYFKGDVTVTTWTLNLESGAWSAGRVFHTEALWKNEIIRTNGLQGSTLVYPALREYEDDMVYFLVNKEPAFHCFTHCPSRKMDDEKEYMIGVNMLSGEINTFESSPAGFPAGFPGSVYSYLTSCFTKYLYGPNK
ncbi:hypothetical protein BAE44_0021516, partial [Dichanthelium oligosanthes]